MNIPTLYWKQIKDFIETYEGYECTFILSNGDQHTISYVEEFILIYNEKDKVSAIEYYGQDNTGTWQQLIIDTESIVEIIEKVRDY